MNRIFKIISPNSGNLCFSGATDFGEYLFEINLYSKTMSSAKYSYYIYGICYEKIENKIDSYLVASNRTYLSRYKNGIITNNYIDTTPYSFVNIFNGNDGFFYGQDTLSNQLVKFSINSFSTEWLYSLDPESDQSNTFSFSKNNDFIYYSNTNGFYTLRDDSGSCALINYISDDFDGFNIITDNFQDEQHIHARLNFVHGTDLNQSSSSSSSSDSSMSSSSSSSTSSSSSIDSSSSSSSSEGYSSSSSSSSSEGNSSSSSIDSSSSSSIDSSSSSSSVGSSSSSSEGTSSSSSSEGTSSSSSEGTSSSSSSSEHVSSIDYLALGWETRGTSGSYTPDYDYNDIITNIIGMNGATLKLSKLGIDSNSLPYYRVRIESGNEIMIQFIDGSGSDTMYPTQQQMLVYKNGVLLETVNIFALSSTNKTYSSLIPNDIIDIRYVHTPSSNDIYNYQLDGSNRTRAKLLYYA